MLKCNILVDKTPPMLNCPSDIIYKDVDTAADIVGISYDVVTDVIHDLSDVAVVHYLPTEGSEVKVLDNIGVTMTVEDHNGNSASCSFIYIIQRKFDQDGSAHESLVLIMKKNSKGSDEPAYLCSLARTFTACMYGCSSLITEKDHLKS